MPLLSVLRDRYRLRENLIPRHRNSLPAPLAAIRAAVNPINAPLSPFFHALQRRTATCLDLTVIKNRAVGTPRSTHVPCMLDLSRKRIHVCVVSDQGELIDRFTPPRIVMACTGWPVGWRCMASQSVRWWSR